MQRKKDKRKFKNSERMWAVQCDGGVGFICGMLATTRGGAIARFREGFGVTDPSWSELSDPAKGGCYRVVRVIVKVAA